MKPGTRTGLARWKLVMIAGGFALLAAGCGSGGTSGTPSSPTSSSTTASPPTSPSAPASPSTSVLCTGAAALRTSLDKLRTVNVGAGTVNQITANLNGVQTALTNFVNNARGQWKAQTSALKLALTTLRASVSNLAAHPGVSAVSSVVAALGGVNTAAQNLLAAVNTSCPSASPSSSA
jgi:hypothetical protein